MSSAAEVLHNLVASFVSLLQAENGQGIADLFRLSKNPLLSLLKTAATVKDVVSELRARAGRAPLTRCCRCQRCAGCQTCGTRCSGSTWK
jgi:hypothetical protein